MQIELWPITRPVPYPGNARKISAEAIEKVALSLKQFGWRQPVVVDAQGILIAGHTRLLAAQQLHLTQVPVHVAHDLTEAQIKAYRLMDNRSHDEALWDVELLGEELAGLEGLGFDLDLTGFEADELAGLSEETPQLYQTESVKLSELKPHPRNYREHPADQLEHIKASIRKNGTYRNVVIAQDSTILAGHGLVKALIEMGRKKTQVVRLPIDPQSPAALKLLIGDNDIAGRGEVSDRTLTEVLKEIQEHDSEGLLGSGYDEMMLANLLFVTRPASEIESIDRAAEWAEAGMPEFACGEKPVKLVISFRSKEDREQYVTQTQLQIIQKQEKNPSWQTWWPPREDDDLISLKFQAAGQLPAGTSDESQDLAEDSVEA